MTYDLVKQRHPGAPCAVGARVVAKRDGREGRIAPPRAGAVGIRVRWHGRFLVDDVDPETIAYAPVEPLVRLPRTGGGEA